MKTAMIATTLLILMAGVASAQTSLGLDFYAGAGITIPLQDVKTGWKIGGQGSLAAGYIFTPGLQAVARYSYYSFPSKGEKIDSSFANTEEKLAVKEGSLEIHGQLSPPTSRVLPFGFVGIGLANLSEDNFFFYCVGGGLKFPTLPKLNFYIEARYSWVSVTDFSVNYVPVSAGINLSL
jgi:hypothetical protein